MIILETKNLKKYYNSEENTVKALDGVNVSVKKGEFVAIVGTSGSGKSTLLHMLGGLDYPTTGEVIVDGTNLATLSKDEQTIFRRRKIGFVFQNYNLLTLLNAYENITLPIQLDGREPDEKFIDYILGVLGLEDKKFSLPSKLSGGQQQRLAMARALAVKPAIILADEPTGNLDSKTSREVIDLMKKISKELDQTVVVITHDNEIAKLSDRIIHIEDGKVVNGERNE